MNERGRALSSVEREFFDEFFKRLGEAGVVRILLRNHEDFPARIGHDLDVFFLRADLPRAIRIFRETLRERDGEVLHVHERDYVCAVWFRAGRGEPEAIHMDFYHGAFTWHGLPYVSESELVAASRPFGRFKSLNPAHEALSLFLTSLLWGGFYKIRYRERIRSLLQTPQASGDFSRLLEREFGPEARPPFDLMSENEPASEEVARYAARLRRLYKARSFRRSPLSTAVQLGRFWLSEYGSMLSPPGICIAILGPDGSGKSTVMQAVKERAEYYFGAVEERHWRPHFLRDVGVLLGRRAETTGPVTDPHGRAPHPFAVSAVRFFYYWLDYWLGYPLRVWKPRAKNHLVIFDRYAQDMWCDPRRYRLRLPRGLMKCFCRLTPQPELAFVLLADAEVIHKRKGEVPLETLRELLRNYGDAARQGENVRVVDCSRPVDEVAGEIVGTVLEQLKTNARRTRHFRDDISNLKNS
jgi:thymidylate kinase